MPVIVTDTASGILLAAMGSRAAGAQAQTILQVLLAMIDLGLNPQEAVDMPRLKIGGTRSTHPDDPIWIEEEMSTAAIESLIEKGHTIGDTLKRFGRSNTGQAHVIAKGNWWDIGASQVNSDVLWTGIDHRCDGKAMTY
uniref:Putative gamma glutamyl transpeptidase n=1 Tax=Ixodes ricinus TaxID=34613 RepID=A0A6B0USY1_IXORI